MGMMDKGFAKIAERAQAFIGDGETVEFACVAFGRHPILLAGGLLGALFGKPRVFAVTDQTVRLLKDESKLKATDLKEELASMPLDQVPELKGLNAKIEFPNGELVYVNRILFGRVNEALGRN